MTRDEQQRRWDLYKESIRNNDLIVQANGIRERMCRVASAFANANGIIFPLDATIFEKLELSKKSVNRAKRLIDAVEKEVLGLRFTKDDIDIMAPPGMTDDEIAEYQNMGWILIVAGIVVVTGVIAHSLWVQSENDKLRDQMDNVLYAADGKFCKDPASDLCQKWLEKKKAEQFEPRKGTIAAIESGITNVAEKLKKGAKTITSGLKIGLMVGIPLLLWSWFGKKS